MRTAAAGGRQTRGSRGTGPLRVGLLIGLWLLGALGVTGTPTGLGPQSAAAQETAVGSILYLSRTTAYVDKGEADGLTVGARLQVVRDGRQIGVLEVDYLAQRSASCRIVRADVALQAGDEVRFTPAPPEPPEEPPSREEPAAEPEAADRYQPKPLTLEPLVLRPEVRGQIGLECRLYDDPECSTDDNLIQPALTVRLDATRVADRPLEVHLRLRSTYTERGRRIDEDRPKTEWEHRLYRLSLVYDDPDKPFRLAVGRLFSSAVGGAGAWDGGLLEVRLGDRWRLGAFGGGTPNLYDGEPDFDQGKVGGYVSLLAGARGRTRYRGTLGFVGQYTACDVSREFVVLANELNLASGLLLRQNLEVDVNRDWRKEAAGEDQTVSRSNALIQYRLHRALRVHVGYDYYQSVRRIENRAIPDSLFPRAWLQGLRVGADVRLSRAVSLGGRIGYRDRERDDKQPVFGNGHVSWRDLLGTGLTLQARYAYADGRFTRSHVPSLDLVRNLGRALRLGLGYGYQEYEGVETESFDAQGQWLRFYGSYCISRRFDAQWLASQTSGDVGEGSRALLRLGYRF